MNLNDIPIYDNRLIYDFIFSNNDVNQFNDLSKLLGYKKNDKLLIIHADDLGLSNSVNKASFEALNKKYINSASVMIPAPNSKEVAEYFKENPDTDLGLHLTFTSEWKNYKWHGISQNDSISSLINSKGNFYEKKKEVIKNSNPQDIRKELQAQIDYAISIGIKPTHLDSHEGVLFFSPEFFKIYLDISKKNKLPVFVPKLLAPHFNNDFPKPKNLVVVKMYMADKNISFDNWPEYYESLINNLEPGLNEMIFHLGLDNNEMKKITSNRIAFGSKWRNLDYNVVSSPEFKASLIKNDIKLVTWREIKEILYP
ncbi:polysaccharide deacetylase family protein [Flavobacteriaceae bacterium]|nr:polysaccharide deacetylase family protein [Flavobacteriaceae bacterium]MDB4063452.1 polysaccharide deacetylase family protein [Flavobacteriaceae bacterium]MDC1392669.1 polysaccharide deacetylase family protein [Flavobacteriaceae bacterium]